MTLLSLLLAGCFNLPTDATQLDTTTIPFDNDYVTEEGGVIREYTTDLLCPDQSAARFHIVYKPDTITPAPVAVVMHSGAFDYEMEPGDDGPLSGPHYHANSRLTSDFAIGKVWETLGLQINDLDPAEANKGTLPAALANRGFLQILPGNCWGDLWHNEEGVQYNDVTRDGFDRNGRTFAWWMVRLASDPAFAATRGIEFPVPIDSAQLYLFGLGDGGRGVLEMLNHESAPDITGALVDSSPDNLAAYTQYPDVFKDKIEGISRIFGAESLETIENYSFNTSTRLPERMVYLWSSGDPQLPSAAAKPAATALNGQVGVKVMELSTQDHVLSNSDIDLANEVLDYLVPSSEPSEAEPEDGEEADDTGAEGTEDTGAEGTEDTGAEGTEDGGTEDEGTEDAGAEGAGTEAS